MLSDIEIANAAVLRPIREVAAETLGIEEGHLVPYGHYKAKVDPSYLASLAERPLGRLVLVTALSPTPPGEGKTTTTVGLTDALHGLGHRTVACLREPSMGPVFGMKGGAAGGGYSQVVPMTDINLHFTGDFAALAAANNLLSALIDNHVHHGNELDIDVRSVTWKRVVDINDRALREVVVGLGGHVNGYPREDGFDIVVASELMAIFCLTESWADLKRRIGDIVIGYTRTKQPVTARDLGARRDGAAAARRTRTQPGADPRARAGVRARRPVRQHRARLQLGDGDPGRPAAGRHRGHRGRVRCRPRRREVRGHQVPQVRPASRRRGGGRDGARAEVPRRRASRPSSGRENLAAVEAGMVNLRRHLDNIRKVYGIPCVVAVNRFPSDTDLEVAKVLELVASEGVRAFPATHFADGGVGCPGPRQGSAGGAGRAVAVRVLLHLPRRPVPDREGGGHRDPAVRRRRGDVGRPGPTAAAPVRARRVRRPAGLRGQDAVLVFDGPSLARRSRGHELHVREVRLSAGAGFVVVVCGDMMTMPGLPNDPSASRIDLADDGTILGLS